MAATFVPTSADAEEVVQETWIAVINGIDRFEGRSTLRTWIFAILVNRARTRASFERKLAKMTEPLQDDAVPADRFEGPAGRGRWKTPLAPWQDDPEVRLQSKEVLRRIAEAIEGLPPARRQVLELRDVQGWSAPEVCDLLGISAANQRVLLHRARSALRTELEGGRDPA